jgi:hypothetical protein
MALRGCKYISDSSSSAAGLYLLDLGQQNMETGSITRKISLENSHLTSFSYQIKFLQKDLQWISCNRLEGTFDGQITPNAEKEAHHITINLKFIVRGLHICYFVIQNNMNPLDQKIVKVKMEVVAPHNIRRNILPSSSSPENNSGRVFDVYVNGMNSEICSLEMESLFYDTIYSSRSIVIYNHETVPLEFFIKCRFELENDEAELLFSVFEYTFKISFLDQLPSFLEA